MVLLGGVLGRREEARRGQICSRQRKDPAARVLLWSRDDDEGHGGSAVVGGTIRRERESSNEASPEVGRRSPDRMKLE